MNTLTFLKFHDLFCKRLKEMAIDKTFFTSDPFAHKKLCESLQVSSTVQGFLLRIIDQFAVLNTFAQNGPDVISEVKAEAALLNMINEAIFMAAFINDSVTNVTATIEQHENSQGTCLKDKDKN